MKQKLMITGAAGFLGSRIAEYYKEKYELLCPTHADLDITDEVQMIHYMNEHKPDILISCAAISDVVTCEKEPEASYRMNVAASIHFAQQCKNTKTKCILCSSDQVYFGSTGDAPHSEDEELQPYNIYGQQKLEMEQKCLRENPDTVILRLAWMYDAARSFEGQHGDFISAFKKNLSEQKVLSYPIYDKRSITDVHDVVQNLDKVFLLSGGIYNYGSYNDSSTYDTVKLVFEKNNLDMQSLSRNEAAFADNHRNLCMNVDKIKKQGIIFPSTVQGLSRAMKDVM